MFINDKNTIKQLYMSKRAIKNQMEDILIICSNYESKYNCVNPRLKLHARAYGNRNECGSMCNKVKISLRRRHLLTKHLATTFRYRNN